MTGVVSPMLGILSLATLCTTQSFAQAVRSKFSTALASVNELHLETRRLDEQAQRCVLIASDLETPARQALDARESYDQSVSYEYRLSQRELRRRR